MGAAIALLTGTGEAAVGGGVAVEVAGGEVAEALGALSAEFDGATYTMGEWYYTAKAGVETGLEEAVGGFEDAVESFESIL